MQRKTLKYGERVVISSGYRKLYQDMHGTVHHINVFNDEVVVQLTNGSGVAIPRKYVLKDTNVQH